jgi:type II secretory ATPase GspE/PulE/Tfp pilus assembly ATPase PilB-like protein
MTKKTDILLAELLIERNLIERERLDVLQSEAIGSGSSLQELLLKYRLMSERDILNLLAEKYGLSFVDVTTLVVDNTVLAKVPLKVATYYKFLPVKIADRVLTVAVSSPLDVKTQDEIRMQLGYDIAVVLACENDVIDSIRKAYGLGAETIDRMAADAPPGEQQSEGQGRIEDIGKQAQDASVIKIVNQIIVDAFKRRSTDIHIEPFREGLSLRYRVDGILYDAHIPEGMKYLLNAIISRIKIMSNLNIVERRLPQDGRAVVKIGDQVLDLRISTIPTPYGESIVIRILPTTMLFSLEKLGLGRAEQQVFEDLIAKPHGIIFVTGPTGSGKTTTLYACLSKINTKERKIITIEDPIEYEMSGITQIQVSSEIGLDFARGLRSMLRHDPDVMMVGEVRDLETAEIAIRVALTGHLVFSTLHTNDAVSAITRLVDIGVEPYLLSSSVEAFIAQRLVRVLCPSCKEEDTDVSNELKKMIAADLVGKAQDEIKIFRGKGCANCNFTGFFGRTAIYEILLVDDGIKDLIMKKAPANQLTKYALSQGMKTLRQDGWHKVISGITTPEEIIKVTTADQEASASPRGAAFEEEALTEKPVSPFISNQRVFHRLSQKVNVRYKVVTVTEDHDGSRDAEYLTVTRNISAGGILFAAFEAPALGSVLALTIEIPDNKESILAHARVVRVEEVEHLKKYDVAVCLLDVTGSQRSRLNKYVESNQ